MTTIRQTTPCALFPLFLAATMAGCGGGGGGMSATTGGGMPPTIDPASTGGFAWSARRVGVAGQSLAGFLGYHDANDSPFSLPGLQRWGSTPPVVRVAADGASSRYVRDVRRAVEIINSALPRDYQLTFYPTLRPNAAMRFGHAEEYFDGEITVNFYPENLGGFMQNSYGREPDIYGPVQYSCTLDGDSWNT